LKILLLLPVVQLHGMQAKEIEENSHVQKFFKCFEFCASRKKVDAKLD